MTVCPICMYRLRVRQAYLDRIHLQQQILQRRNQLHREWLVRQQLRLQATRNQANGRLAAARERNRVMLAFMRSRPRGWWYLR